MAALNMIPLDVLRKSMKDFIETTHFDEPLGDDLPDDPDIGDDEDTKSPDKPLDRKIDKTRLQL